MRDVIESGTGVFIDANIFLYETFDHWRYGEPCRNFLEEVNKKYGLLSNDAIHVATMKRQGITNIATNDPDFERVEWINIWKP